MKFHFAILWIFRWIFTLLQEIISSLKGFSYSMTNCKFECSSNSF